MNHWLNNHHMVGYICLYEFIYAVYVYVYLYSLIYVDIICGGLG